MTTSLSPFFLLLLSLTPFFSFHSLPLPSSALFSFCFFLHSSFLSLPFFTLICILSSLPCPLPSFSCLYPISSSHLLFIPPSLTFPFPINFLTVHSPLSFLSFTPPLSFPILFVSLFLTLGYSPLLPLSLHFFLSLSTPFFPFICLAIPPPLFLSLYYPFFCPPPCPFPSLPFL